MAVPAISPRVSRLKNVLGEFNEQFSSLALSDVIEKGQDKNEEQFRQGADAVVVDLDCEGQHHIGKRLHSIFFEMFTDLEGMASILQRFCQEIVLVSRLDHKNIIRFIGVYYSSYDELALQLPMLVMEKVPFSLTQYIETYQDINIPEDDVVSVLCDIARGLVYLHQNHHIVHGDLSSNNILLDFTFSAKIADFGSAQKLRGQHAVTQLAKQPGTPAFMPPEALVDLPCYTISLDVFSFGCLIIHMATGEIPVPIGEAGEVSELKRRQHFIARMKDSFLTPTVVNCLDVEIKRPTCKEILADLFKVQRFVGRVNGDRLEKAFKLMKEAGAYETLKYLLNITSESQELTSVQEDFQGVEVGDHLVYKTPIGWSVNFYVVANLGNGQIRVSTFLDGSGDPFIEGELLLNPEKAKRLKILEILLSGAQIIDQANIFKKVYRGTANITVEMQNLEKFKCQKNSYDFLGNNSEHFVMFIKTGMAKCEMCKEIESVFMKSDLVSAIKSNGLEKFTRKGWALHLDTVKDSGVATTYIAANEIGKATIRGAAAPAKELIKVVLKSASKQVSREVIEEGVASQAAKVLAYKASSEGLKQTVGTTAGATTKAAALNAIKQSAKGAVIAGVLVEGALYTAQLGNAVYKHKNGKMDDEELKHYAVERSTMSGGSAIVGIGGSVAGAAAGSAIGSVVPVVGTVVGGAVGGVLGGFTGGLLGTAVGKGTGVAINYLRGTKEWNFGFKNPCSITITPNNELLILDTIASQVLMVDHAIKVFMVHGNVFIDKPSCIAVSKVIAVGYNKSHHVKIFSREGEVLSTIEDKAPLGLCFNSKAILYVVDSFRFYRFDTCNNNEASGEKIWYEGADLEQCYPVSISADTNDNVYVIDCYNNCIHVYSECDHMLLYKIDCNSPCAIAFTPDNHMIVADENNNCLRVFSPPLQNRFFKKFFKSRNENIYSRQVVNKFGEKGTGKLEFDGICGIAVNKQGTVYVADSKNDRIQIVGTMIWRKTKKVKD